VDKTLYDFLPKLERPVTDLLLGRFLDYVTARGLELYPAQEQAILDLYDEKHVILNTPTGSGKSMVAAALHFKALAQGRRSVYTCPIKALVNEKWLSLCKEFGPDNVGLSTGDATINRDAPILCCTAEILANLALRDGPECVFKDVIVDEFHYYSDRERGVAWQVPLLTLSKSRFLLMSATLGDTTFFEDELRSLTGKEVSTVKSVQRPVPLDFTYSETPLSQTLEKLVADGKAPVYVVHFTQAEAAESAQDFTSINVASREEKAAIAAAIEGQRFNSPYGPDIKRWLRHGIGLHHAGLLPKYRILIEQLAQRGLLKVICGTDTLGVGINVPIRTVLFTRLCKYDGQKVGILTSRDFHQVAGRAGRKGYDNVGWVVAQAPEHVVENLKLEEKAARDGKKVVKKKAPEKNFVSWDRNTYTRLIGAPPERLQSRFQVSHAMLLNVLSRPTDGCRAMQDLIRRCHDSPTTKKNHRKRAWQLFRSLLDRKIVEVIPRTEAGAKVRVNVELPEDFSLNQVLSLYLLDTLRLLDREAPDYALDVITLVESILEDPDLILRRQLDKVKDQKMAEWKASGMEYNERMDELEKLEYPKPKREFVYETFNAFSEKHPWVGQENIRPKSIAREMFESYRSFSDYIKIYDLHRVEGLLLRHLMGVWKVLRQTVPAEAKTETVQEMEEYLSTMLRQIDSSLLDEWEKMRNPDYAPKAAAAEVRPPGAEEAAKDVTRDEVAFTAAIRARVFLFLRSVANDAFEEALSGLPGTTRGEGNGVWTPEALKALVEPYYADHQWICMDPGARNRQHTHVVKSEDRKTWKVEQIWVDPEEKNDWSAVFVVDLDASRAASQPIFILSGLGPVGRHAAPVAVEGDTGDPSA
jgi:superfamily II RNA helicase